MSRVKGNVLKYKRPQQQHCSSTETKDMFQITMSGHNTQHQLRQMSARYLRARGVPRLRDAAVTQKEASDLLDVSGVLLNTARNIMNMSNLFRDAHLDPNIQPSVWDSLVRNYSAEELEIVRQTFPREQWPDDIPYPNLVALVGHIDETLAIEKAVSLAEVSKNLANRSISLIAIANAYITALIDPATDPEMWDALVSDLSEDDLEPVRELFPRDTWPADIPYPNLVALAKWIIETRVKQGQLSASLSLEMFGGLEIFDKMRELLERRRRQ